MGLLGLTDVATSPVGGMPIANVWTILTQSDDTANDNDKTFTVTAGTEWEILWIWVEYTSDANVGDRQLEITLRDDSDDVIGQVRPGIVQAASLTRYYMFAPALADLMAFRDTDYLMTPFPPSIFLQAGYDVRIRDNNNVSGNDDMVLKMQVAQRTV